MPELPMLSHSLAPIHELLLAGLAGTVLGAFFFGGLWWTARRSALSSRPAWWFMSSLWLRMGVVLWGFHAVGGGHWERILACLLGFVVARVVVMRLTRPSRPDGEGGPRERHHAP